MQLENRVTVRLKIVRVRMRSKPAKNVPLRHVSTSVERATLGRSENGMRVILNQNLVRATGKIG